MIQRLSPPPETPEDWAAEVAWSPTQNLAFLMALNRQALAVLAVQTRLWRRQMILGVLWFIVAMAWCVQAGLHLAAALL